MIKIIKYLIQATIVYLFFIIIKLIGLKLGRKLFTFLFNKIGPLIKSKKTIDENLKKFIGLYNEDKKKEIIFNMWSNYGKIFVEYLYLKKFRNNNSHIRVKGEHIIKNIRKNNKKEKYIADRSYIKS